MTLEAHPAAAIFPLLAGAELQALAEDIRAHGLREPGKVDADGLLLDGRNRQAACELAGVAFTTVPAELNGDDPVAYVVSLNVKRRNLRAGAVAIAAARAWDQVSPDSGGKQGRAGALAAMFGIGHGPVQQARALVERDPLAADDVGSGRQTLAAAYDALRERERRAESQADKRARLGRHRPDLVERVDAGELSIDEADDLAAADELRERQQRATMVANIGAAVRVLARPAVHAEHLVDELELAEHPHDWKAADVRVAAEFLAALAARLDRKARR